MRVSASCRFALAARKSGLRAVSLNGEIVAAKSPSAVLTICSSFGCEFDAVNMATAIHRIAKTTGRPESV
eukprot:CAMPEP_0115118620 /NCGR_PEP_ID=MMETSP0227-20121206/44606_1 /TAXON_ID=89957 /ORGANISM="Polarella glacialis, Strain CCMP 1383" /LENGTH=69 /DNA_ID=CAMNT_0002519937 /DNA_START=61 /DNA_END=270 /DNA_ORIENTATION=-